jgi:hypothetical protein
VVVPSAWATTGQGLQDELAYRGGPARQGRDTEITDEHGGGVDVQRLAASASGKHPAGTGVGGGLEVVALGGGLQQKGGEWLGHRGGRSPNRIKTCPSAAR